MDFMSSEAQPAEGQSPMVEDTNSYPDALTQQYPEQTISQVEPYQPMEKPTDEGGDAIVKKVVIEDGPETDAELKLKEETEKAKKELIDQIKNFNAEDAEAAILESED